MIKKIIATTCILFIFLIIIYSCEWFKPSSIPEVPYGNLNIKFSFDENTSLADLSIIENGKILLRQDQTIAYSKEIDIDKTKLNGTCKLTTILTGEYNIAIELYDANGQILFITEDNVEVYSGINGEKEMPAFQQYQSNVIISGTWTGDIADIISVHTVLKQDDTEYEINMMIENTSVNGQITDIYPGDYILTVDMLDAEMQPVFKGIQLITLNYGTHYGMLSLNLKTGIISISLNQGVSPPEITSGPSVEVNGTEATITWLTNKQATSNVYYSGISGFNFQSQIMQVPVEMDLTSDTTGHTVILSNLTLGQVYYYVVVTSDRYGNMTVSSEYSFLVESLSPPGLLSPLGNITWDFAAFYEFSWSEPVYTGSGITSYRILIDDDPEFLNPEYDNTTTDLMVNIYNDFGKFIKGNYFWKVIASDNSERNTASDIGNITVEDHPPTTVLFAPQTQIPDCYNDTIFTFSWDYYDHDNEYIHTHDIVFYLYIDDDDNPFAGALRTIYLQRSDLDFYNSDHATYTLKPEEALLPGIRYSWALDGSSNGINWKRSNDINQFSICE